MNFAGPGRPISQAGWDFACTALTVGAAELWAVLMVETAQFGFLADRRPRILFERHVFHKLTGGTFDRAAPDISNAVAGGYVGGAGEYDRLARAMACDADAALQSASWGVGQIMGVHHAVAGFATVDDMVAAMVRGEDAQLGAVVSYIRYRLLDAALRGHDWAAFARGYNGAMFAENRYDVRLATACAQYERTLPDLRVRSAQVALTYLGFDPGPIDGALGPRTRAALTMYQRYASLAATGELDVETDRVLGAAGFGVAA